jgi:hypothetical protein
MFTSFAVQCSGLSNQCFLKQQIGVFVQLNRTIATLPRKFDEAYAMAEMSWAGEVPCVCDDT